jgi:peptidyl-prolyl cis-trans isomerase A (cyclophilin A)
MHRRLCLQLVCIAALVALAAAASNVAPVWVSCRSSVVPSREIVIEVLPEWAPNGAKRFLELVDAGFYSNTPLYRVVPGWLTQFGARPNLIAGLFPAIPDDPRTHSTFEVGMMSFAGTGLNSRTTEVFIGLGGNFGSAAWERPFGRIIHGMDIVHRFYAGYGDMSAFNPRGIDPSRIVVEGQSYLQNNYPNLDYLLSCSRAKTPEPDLSNHPPRQEL